MWGSSTKFADCKEALASIARVTGDVLDRLRAEFTEDDLVLAYEAFDLQAWQEPEAEPGGIKLSKMLRAARRLCRSIGVDHDAAAWREGAQAALLARGPDGNNRDAWRSCLDADRLPSALPAEVVRLYLATWDGTGAVERGLGQDAAIIGQHVGSRTRSCLDADLYSCLLELKQEGPRKEEDMFTPNGMGVLYFTEFSRACAAEWLVQRGRRFTCSIKDRKDKGQKASRGNRSTDRGVQLRARKAYSDLIDMAKVDEHRSVDSRRATILGVDRVKLAQTINKLTPAADGKKNIAFP